ncbi:hypothetical protein ACA910_007066 [Epithemia clementina (nom. ined.)]
MKATGLYSHVDDGDLVTVQNALTECEAVWLQALVDCMHEQLPLTEPFYEERLFGDEDRPETYGLYKEAGGNHVTFLASLLPRFLPGVAHSLYQAVHAAFALAQWGEPHTFAHDRNFYSGGGGLAEPMTLGIRTAEYLQYHTTGRLGQHADTGSLYTISVALSNPDDYQGGYFQMKEGQNVFFRPPRLSAVVFYSEAMHGITPITAGQRKVLVAEFWSLGRPPFGFPRPSVEEMQDYLFRRHGILPESVENNDDNNDDDDNDDDDDDDDNSEKDRLVEISEYDDENYNNLQDSGKANTGDEL